MTTEYTGAGDLTRSMELLWGKHERPSRGPKPSLTVEKIVQAAIDLADAEGLAAVSMRHIAARLDVGTMSLYRYVPSKAELLDVMLDRVYGEQPVLPDPAGGWRKGLEQVARGQWDLYHRHTWLLQISQGRPVMGPNAIKGYEQTLKVMAGIGLSDVDRVAITSMIDSFVSGSARNKIEAEQATQRTGVTDEQFWTAQAPFFTEIMTSGQFPEMAGLDGMVYVEVIEKMFEFGLERLLDGLETYISAKTRRTASPDPTGEVPSG
jgi:AcrR family transcriptional regulator